MSACIDKMNYAIIERKNLFCTKDGKKKINKLFYDYMIVCVTDSCIYI